MEGSAGDSVSPSIPRRLRQYVADRLVAATACVLAAFAVSLFDHTGREAGAPPPNAASLGYARGVGLMIALWLGFVHVMLLTAFSKRWPPVGLIARGVTSGISGAGGYLLLLGTILMFRSTYADPLQSTWILGVLLAAPTVITTALAAELLRRRAGN